MLLSTAFLSMASQWAEAAKVPPCGPLPAYVRDADRTMSACVTSNYTFPVGCKKELDIQEFNNNEGKLPTPGNGQSYLEGKARHEDGPAGTNRFVFLVENTASGTKMKIDQKYYSSDHYQSFCINP